MDAFQAVVIHRIGQPSVCSLGFRVSADPGNLGDSFFFVVACFAPTGVDKLHTAKQQGTNSILD